MDGRLAEALRTATAVLALTTMVACGNVAVDRAGGDTVRLRFATLDGEPFSTKRLYGTEVFVEQLEDISGGRLVVEIETDYGEGAPDAEVKLVSAIADGEVDGGWPATRSFSAAGIPGLQAVEAPLLLTSAAAVQDLLSGPALGQMLDRLDGSGVVGLGMVAGPLRRPFAGPAPLVAPSDWAGIRFRSYGSPVQADTVRALGGTPVDATHGWADQVAAGELHGAEFDLTQYAENGFTTQAAFVTTDVVLWPKVLVLAMSEKRYETLTDQQRRWLREAASRAMEATGATAHDESDVAREVCDSGVRLVEAGPEQLAALEAAVVPVHEQLAGDPVEAPLLAEVRAVAQRHPDPDRPDVPSGCEPTVAPSPTATAGAPSTLPDGVYRVAISTRDVWDAGLGNGPGWSGTWTLEVKGGTYVLSCQALDAPGKDCGNSTRDGPLEAGELRGTGGEVTFVSNPEMLSSLTGCALPPSTDRGHCPPASPYTATWQADGDRLTFSEATRDGLHLDIEPWQRIG